MFIGIYSAILIALTLFILFLLGIGKDMFDEEVFPRILNGIFSLSLSWFLIGAIMEWSIREFFYSSSDIPCVIIVVLTGVFFWGFSFYCVFRFILFKEIWAELHGEKGSKEEENNM